MLCLQKEEAIQGVFLVSVSQGNLTSKGDQGKYYCNTELGSFPM